MFFDDTRVLSHPTRLDNYPQRSYKRKTFFPLPLINFPSFQDLCARWKKEITRASRNEKLFTTLYKQQSFRRIYQNSSAPFGEYSIPCKLPTLFPTLYRPRYRPGCPVMVNLNVKLEALRHGKIR